MARINAVLRDVLEKETALRKQFMATSYQHLPHNLLPTLANPAPTIAYNLSQAELRLPSVQPPRLDESVVPSLLISRLLTDTTEVQALRVKTERLENELQQSLMASTALHSVTDELARKEAESQEQTRLISNLEQRIELRQSEIQEFQKKLDVVFGSKTEAEQKNETLQEALKAATDRASLAEEALRSNRREDAESKGKSDAAVRAALEERDRTATAVLELEAERQSLTDDLGRARAEVEQLRQRVSNLTVQSTEANAALERSRLASSALEKQTSTDQQKVTEAIKAATALRKLLDDAQDQLTESQLQVRSLQEDVASAAAALIGAQTQLAEERRIRDEQASSLELARKQVSAAQAAKDDEIRLMKSSLEALKAAATGRADQLGLELRQERDKGQAVAAQLEALRAEHNSTRGELAGKEAELGGLKDSLLNLRREYENRQVTKEAELNSLRVSLGKQEALNLQVSQLQQSLLQAGSAEAELTQAQEQLRKLRVTSSDELNNARKESEQLQRQVRQLKEASHQQDRELAQAKEATRAETQKTLRLGEEQTRLNAELEQSRGRVRLLEEQEQELQTLVHQFLDSSTSGVSPDVTELRALRDRLAVVEGLAEDKGKQLVELNAELVASRGRVEQLKRLAEQAEKNAQTKYQPVMDQLFQQVANLEAKRAAINNIAPGNLAIFFLNANTHYQALSLSGQHLFLDPDSFSSFPQEMRDKRPIVGKVVLFDDKEATERNNPYNLPNGSKYSTVIIERA